jgi:hypothetical protein
MLGASPQAADAVGERTGREQQCSEHQRVAVHHPLQPSDAATQGTPDVGQGDVDHQGVERDDEKAEHRDDQRRANVKSAVPRWISGQR